MSVEFNKSGVILTGGDTIGDNLIKESRSNNIALTGSDYVARSTRTFDVDTGIGRIEIIKDDGAWNAWKFVTSVLIDTIPNLSTGIKTYTYSIDIKVSNYTKGTIRATIDFRTGGTVNANAHYDLTTAECDGNWHRVHGTMTTNNEQNTAALLCITSNGTIHNIGTVIEYKNPKLEVGTVPTTWIMATTDTSYIGSNHGLIETTTLPSRLYDNHIETIEYIEY